MIQWAPLAKTLALQMVKDPLFVPQILGHVGPVAIIDWVIHFIALGFYTVMNAIGPLLRPLADRLPPNQRYWAHRTFEQWEYGAGQDYRYRP